MITTCFQVPTTHFHSWQTAIARGHDALALSPVGHSSANGHRTERHGWGPSGTVSSRVSAPGFRQAERSGAREAGARKSFFFFLNDPAPPDIYPFPPHAPLPI